MKSKDTFTDGVPPVKHHIDETMLPKPPAADVFNGQDCKGQVAHGYSYDTLRKAQMDAVAMMNQSYRAQHAIRVGFDLNDDQLAACQFYYDNPSAALFDFSRRLYAFDRRDHVPALPGPGEGRIAAFLGWVDPMCYLNFSRGLSTKEWVWAKPEHGNLPVYLVATPTECLSNPALLACLETEGEDNAPKEVGSLSEDQIEDLALTCMDKEGRVKITSLARAIEKKVVERLSLFPVVIGDSSSRLAAAEKRVIELELLLKQSGNS